MRVEFAYEMTDELARAGNELLLAREMRGITWRGPVFWFAFSLATLIGLIAYGVTWPWLVGAGLSVMIFFLAVLVVFVMPLLHRIRLRLYLQQVATWPHRQVSIALTPDVIELTTPQGTGVLDRSEVTDLLEGGEVTALLLARKILVPMPTASIPEAAWPLLRRESPAPAVVPPTE